MKFKVLKFGGTSVRTAEARHLAALKVISAKEQGFAPVVVVSAIGRRGEPYATDTLKAFLEEADPTTVPDAREMDLVMACGEIVSASVFATLLKGLGCPAMSLRGGQAGIRTDGVYGNSRILGIQPLGVIEAVERGYVPVVCGFQGVWVQGGLPGAELTTLGRGGSDTSAAALGAALRAEAVEIYTDVDGVKTADPDFVKDAPTLRRVTYDEVAEIAHLGAKVLHPRAAEIAMKFDIPLWVKSTFSEEPGTEIVPSRELPGRRVTGVTHSGKLVYYQVDLNEAEPGHVKELQSRIYDALARYEVNVFMTNLGPTSIGFAVEREMSPEVQDMLDALVLPAAGQDRVVYLVQSSNEPTKALETQRKLLEPLGEVRELKFAVNEGCTMVSLVAYDFLQQPGVFYRVMSLMHGEGIPILQTNDSDYSLSVLIPESELRRAVAVLHEEFGLSAIS
ncbi:MAG: aspartate kinase [Armatimonadetes bacterium]|nr:aspartate kinase [Armatimonadota bacterium]MBS1710293.1 aspartate kinase [Armatimonadota bacterium]MBX3109070.1 aspartate kinase [Fimbriimonadaceae bacterium]